MKKILAIVLMAAVLVCPAFASGEASAQPAATTTTAAEAAPAAAPADAPFYVLQVIQPATCTENGVSAYVDNNSGDVLFTFETAATGHVPSADAPTCTDPVVCAQCGEVLEPAVGHSYSYQYDAVQNEDGSFASFGTWKCDNCGDEVAATEGNAVYYYGVQEEPAASEETPAGEGAPAASNSKYDPAGHNWASIEIVMAIIIVAVGAVLMLSFGKKKNV